MNRRDFLMIGSAMPACSLLASPASVAASDWFPMESQNDFTSPSVIGLADWLDKPAGRHGFVQAQGNRLVFEDGVPVKFWGANICNARVAPSRDRAERHAAKLAKYGVNLVRMHKFTWPGDGEGIGSPADSLQLDEGGAARWDRLVAELSARGIYMGWSHIYGHRLSPADKSRILAYDEIMQAGLPWAHLRQSTIGLVNFAADLQDLSIGLTVNMLNRRNTVTGQRYADDRSLAYIEMQNEDDIFWGHTQTHLDACPSYKKLLHQQFSGWLATKYGSDEKLRAAWGAALQPGESLAGSNIAARASTEVSTEIQEAMRGGQTPQRLLDNSLFLHETQNAFYHRFSAAIRQTGYRGVIVGSCWMAGEGVSHYYNLRSDQMIGMVDRHNYSEGPIAMLAAPGSAILSTGMQQLADRPFGISEWKSTTSSPWQNEAPPILAVYGLGLQGWSMSCEFASDFDTMTGPMGEFIIDVPGDMGQYPALARLVHRGDIKAGEPVSVGKVSLEELHAGRIPFPQEVHEDGDVKSYSGPVPLEALAVGKVLIEFADKPAPPAIADISKYFDRERKIVHSNTGQLLWDYSGGGFFTVDTPGTQAVIGFAAGRDHELSDVLIRLETPFALVYVTSLDRHKPIAQASGLLITVLARTANTGMTRDAGSKVVQRGRAPVLMEPVNAVVTFRRKGEYRVQPLDHDGRMVAGMAALPLRSEKNGTSFSVSGARHRALYYFLECLG